MERKEGVAGIWEEGKSIYNETKTTAFIVMIASCLQYVHIKVVRK